MSVPQTILGIVRARRSCWRPLWARVSVALALAGAIAAPGLLASPALALAVSGNTSISGQIVGIAGKCLDNSGGSTANGNPIVLSTCNGSAEQQWTLPGDGTIRNQGHCLAVQHAGVTSMTPGMALHVRQRSRPAVAGQQQPDAGKPAFGPVPGRLPQRDYKRQSHLGLHL